MSAEAVGWCWKHSPATGIELLLHLAVADVVNDLHDHQFFMSPSRLAAKARCGRQKASEWLWRMVEDGWLDLIEDNRETVDPATGRRNVPSCFRFRVEQRTQEESCVATDDAGATLQTTQDSLFCVAPDDAAASPQTTHKKNSKKKNSIPMGDVTVAALCQGYEEGTLRRRIIRRITEQWTRLGHLPPDATMTEESRDIIRGAVEYLVMVDEHAPEKERLNAERLDAWAAWNEPFTLKARQPVWDALVIATFGHWWQPLSKNNRGRVCAAEKSLREARATPDEVFARARRYRRKLPDCPCTPNAIDSNWGMLAQDADDGVDHEFGTREIDMGNGTFHVAPA